MLIVLMNLLVHALISNLLVSLDTFPLTTFVEACRIKKQTRSEYRTIKFILASVDEVQYKRLRMQCLRNFHLPLRQDQCIEVLETVETKHPPTCDQQCSTTDGSRKKFAHHGAILNIQAFNLRLTFRYLHEMIVLYICGILIYITTSNIYNICGDSLAS